MNKVLLYSIAPEHMLNILNGSKTIEIRKRTLPKWALDVIAQGDVVDGYGYCTKGGERLAFEKQPKHPYYILSNSDGVHTANGLVVVKFQVSGVKCHNLLYFKLLPLEHFGLDKACILKEQLANYMNIKKGDDISQLKYYAHHLTNIQPIEPMEMGEFMVAKRKPVKLSNGLWKPSLYADMVDGEARLIYQLQRAYQSFGTAWVKGRVDEDIS